MTYKKSYVIFIYSFGLFLIIFTLLSLCVFIFIIYNETSSCNNNNNNNNNNKNDSINKILNENLQLDVIEKIYKKRLITPSKKFRKIVNNTIPQPLSINKCEPMYVFISWLKVKKYVKKHYPQEFINIPKRIEGSSLQVKKCLYFMTSCGLSDEFCLKLIEKNSVRVGNIKSDNKLIGYYQITIIEDYECICTNDKLNKKETVYPWKTPDILNFSLNRLL